MECIIPCESKYGSLLLARCEPDIESSNGAPGPPSLLRSVHSWKRGSWDLPSGSRQNCGSEWIIIKLNRNPRDAWCTYEIINVNRIACITKRFQVSSSGSQIEVCHWGAYNCEKWFQMICSAFTEWFQGLLFRCEKTVNMQVLSSTIETNQWEK